MKISFISGINYPNFVEQGNIAFTLCDWILSNHRYAEYYNKSKAYKITDNMAAENGISSSADLVLKAARMVKSNEIWAPDKLYDKDETIKLTKEFLDKMNDSDKQQFKIVGLPQGKDFNEWIDCYKQMLEMPEIEIIALSKYSCPKAFASRAGTDIIGKARPVAVKYLAEHDLIKKPLHLAGADNFILDEIKEMKKYPQVRSIDSNICFKLGVHRIKIDECEIEPTERLNHNVSNLDLEQIKIINYNIQKVKEINEQT